MKRPSSWLSPRECEVVNRLAWGESFKWISFKLGVAPATVRTFAKRAYRKLGVSDRHAAAELHGKHRQRIGRECNARHRPTVTTELVQPK